MKTKLFLLRVAVSAAMIASNVGAYAATPADDAKKFFSPSTYGGAILSPDGERIAFVTPVKGRKNLVIMNIADRKMKPITGFTDADVHSVNWANNDRLLFSLADEQAAASDGRQPELFGIDVDGKHFKQLYPIVHSSMGKTAEIGVSFSGGYPWYVFTPSGWGDDVVVSIIEGSRDRFTTTYRSRAYRLNTRTGDKQLLSKGGPDNTNSWVFDTHGVARVAFAHESDKEQRSNVVYYRDSTTAPWQKLATYDETGHGMYPITIGEDGQLTVLSDEQGDTWGLYPYDTKTRKLGDTIISHPRFDIDAGGVGLDRDTLQPISVMVDEDTPKTYHFTDLGAELQATVDAALPNTSNFLQYRKASRWVLVASGASNMPDSFYLLDRDKRTLEFLVRTVDRVEPEQLQKTTTVDISARDGERLPLYLTNAGKGDKRPMVVLVHGGPWARDSNLYNPEVQFLAAQGYAVLQPQFRGSTGFGRQHFEKGWKQFGQAMQDDITDSVQWAIDKGYADSKRICIMGASYGGYAALIGLAKTPALYQCGVSMVGVTDLPGMFEAPWTDELKNDWYTGSALKMIGDPDKDAKLLADNSPINLVDRIKAPVLIAHGAEDPRVPYKQGAQMADRLSSAGKQVEWLSFQHEGHGFYKPENRIEFYTRAGEFLAKYLKPVAKQ